MLKAGIDYTLNSKNAISFSCLLNKDLDSDQDHVGYMYLDRNDILSESSKREMNGMASYKGQEGDLSYTRSFDRAEKIFSAEISASANKNNAVDSISQQNFLPNQTPIGYYPSFQKTENKGSLQMFKAKADLTQPIGDAVQLNAGLKASFRVLDGNFSSDTLRQPAKEWVRDTSVNNHFGYEEQIYGAYASWNQKVQRFSYELGGRVEDSRVLITLGHPNISFTRHNTDFFPYAHISLKKSETEEIRFGYSRRINRPPFRFLNPFADYTDPLNLHYGNPYLKSEYANAFELAYTKYFKKTSFNANLYFRRVENAIQVFKTLSDSLTGASVSTYANLHRDDILGVEVITKMDLLTWLNLTWNLNAYEITLNSDDPNYSSRIHSFNVIAKMTSRMSLRKGFLILISGSYSNGEKTMQGMVHEQYYLDMSVRKDFMKQKLGISLGLSDVFNSFNNQSEIITSQISQQYLKKRESRFATVTISYNFGQMGEASRKHKTQEETPVPALPEQE
jgi:outer membrane receptor protein involved in Fe transport